MKDYAMIRLVNRDLNGLKIFLVKSIRNDRTDYDINELGVICQKCGGRSTSKLKIGKICAVRCDECSKTMYIIPIDNGEEIIDFMVMTANEYKNNKKMYDESCGKSFVEYMARHCKG